MVGAKSKADLLVRTPAKRGLLPIISRPQTNNPESAATSPSWRVATLRKGDTNGMFTSLPIGALAHPLILRSMAMRSLSFYDLQIGRPALGLRRCLFQVLLLGGVAYAQTDTSNDQSHKSLNTASEAVVQTQKSVILVE